MTQEENPIKINDVAKTLSINPRTVRRWIRKGLPAYRPGKAYYLYMSEVNQWLKETKHESNNTGGR